MGRRFLILHGIENRRPPDHWQHWLTERLRSRGEQVQYPQLPRPDAPVFAEWEDLLHAELAQMGDGERVVVCHSLGCILWLRSAPRPPVDRVLLVAPPSRQVTVRVAPSFALGAPVDLDAAAASARACTVVCSDADPYNPEGEGPALAEALGSRLQLVEGGGHLAVDDGYGEWPALEQWCMEAPMPGF